VRRARQDRGVAGSIFRLCGIAACALAWWWLGQRGLAKGIPEGLLLILAAHGALVVAAILLARPVVGLIGHLLSGLYLPGGYSSPPRPDYSAAEERAAAGDHLGALKAYAEMAARHPGEIAPHLRMMEIRLLVDRDEEAARLLRDKALRSIKGASNRKQFRKASAFLLGETPRR